MSQDAEDPKRKKPSRAKPPKGRVAERLKCSLLLTAENDLRLTVLATLRGMDRSTLVNAILDDSLRGVVVSLRGPLSAEAGGAGEGTAEPPDAEAA